MNCLMSETSEGILAAGGVDCRDSSVAGSSQTFAPAPTKLSWSRLCMHGPRRGGVALGRKGKGGEWGQCGGGELQVPDGQQLFERLKAVVLANVYNSVS